jgi:hypothetical protein
MAWCQWTIQDDTEAGPLLSHGNVYAKFGGCGPDPKPYHGWLLGYNADMYKFKSQCSM